MQEPLPISVFIITLNEVDRVHRTILSVRDWVQEVVVVDSGSTDGTPQACEELGAKVVHHDWQGYGPQKRFAETLCQNRWLFNLDADEEVSAELVEEIKELFVGGLPEAAGFVLRIRDLLPGETSIAAGAHTNFVLRLYDRECGRFSDSPVHDSVQLEKGSAFTLKGVVMHRSYRSWAHVVEKMNRYTSMQAESMLRKPMRLPGLRLALEFPFAFLKDYFLRGYVWRGRRGFINSVSYAYGRFLRIAKYLEAKERR